MGAARWAYKGQRSRWSQIIMSSCAACGARGASWVHAASGSRACSVECAVACGPKAGKMQGTTRGSAGALTAFLKTLGEYPHYDQSAQSAKWPADRADVRNPLAWRVAAEQFVAMYENDMRKDHFAHSFELVPRAPHGWRKSFQAHYADIVRELDDATEAYDPPSVEEFNAEFARRRKLLGPSPLYMGYDNPVLWHKGQQALVALYERGLQKFGVEEMNVSPQEIGVAGLLALSDAPTRTPGRAE